jgi:hypothetical protein
VRLVCVVAVLLLLASPVRAGESETEDQTVADSVEDTRGPIRRAFGRPEAKEPLLKGLKEKLQDFPPFIADTQLTLQYRTVYRNKQRLIGIDSEAWAMGGWLAYRSGKLFDLVAAELKAFGSIPVYAPDDADGTQLLKPGQQGYGVLGVANLDASWKELSLTAGRMELGTPYVNRNDSRMTPNTFEAITVLDTTGPITGGFGYLHRIKPRNSDDFISMSRRLLVDEKRGMASAGLYWDPREDVYLGGIDHFAIDTFNTLYLEGGYVVPLGDELAVKLEAQFTDQRSVGEELVGSFDTQSYGIRASGSAFGAILKLGYSQTAKGATIRSPWGANPSYVGLMQRDFTRAGEKALLAGFSWDLARVGIPHLSGFVNFVHGWDAKLLGRSRPSSRSLDATLDYKVQEGFFRGFWLRLRGSWLGETNDSDNATDIRLIVNYELPLL